MKMADYLKEEKKLADNLALARKLVALEDLVTQVLTGLDLLEQNPVVCKIYKKENISWVDLQAILLSYEKRLEQINVGMASMNLGQMTANIYNIRPSIDQSRGRGSFSV